jgi:hypothetical protein
MFRALPCSSSGGQIVLLQHLVSSLSVNGCRIRRLRASSLLSTRRQKIIKFLTDCLISVKVLKAPFAKGRHVYKFLV